MNEFNRFTFYPVTGWHIGPLSDHQALVLKLGYVDPDAPDDQAMQETRFFGLTIEMAKSLVSHLSEQIASAEKAASNVTKQ
ncbi:hypothetical protein [Pantoea sp. ARC607]|uniref:hypothetical protein n=1 Tax=unclassified Pantoea TaxID=2630326 RepID=UPI000DA7696C|nr:hypothetical protein [Pantoea sp. ARC607]PZL97639.1 hypothetical protein CKF43_03995 [Pantoea sp. ARC607]